MSNKPQMVTGFNHNIKHNGQIYHVQTEDSGAANPHIITHLFVGGNILATKKTSYADIVHADNLHDIVRELMQEQHKAMLRNLINGVYDNIGSSPAGPAAAAAAAEAQAAAAAPQQAAAQQAAAQQAAAQQATAQQAAAQQAAAQQAAAQQAAAQQAAAQQAAAQQPVTLTPKAAAEQPAAAQDGQFPPPAEDQPQAASGQTQPPVAAEPTGTGSAGGFSRPKSSTTIHRPPEPERVPTAARPTTKVTLRPKNPDAAQAAEAAAEATPEAVQPTVQLPAAQAGQAAQAAQATSDAPTVENLPVVPQAEAADVPPEVLAAQRLAEKPKPKDTSGPTIFGENLISEKSLDEVILGYLAGSEE